MNAAWSVLPESRFRVFKRLAEGLAGNLRDLLDFAVAYARGAYTKPAAGAVHDCSNTLQVQIPAALGDIVGVTDAVAKLRAAAAHFAYLCHKTNLIVPVRPVFSQLAHALEV